MPQLLRYEATQYRSPPAALPIEPAQSLGIDPALTANSSEQSAFAPLLGNITLPHESVSLLCDICREHGADPLFRAHSPTLTAAEKGRIVAPARVQKTITVRLDDIPVLCTAIGNPVLDRATFRAVAEQLGLARTAAKKLHVNPREFDPMACFEMAPGMVSPFLRPGRATPIRAVVLTETDDTDGTDRCVSVAVSLSLRWSLLIDASRFPHILREYAARAYPHVRWIDLRGAGA